MNRRTVALLLFSGFLAVATTCGVSGLFLRRSRDASSAKIVLEARASEPGAERPSLELRQEQEAMERRAIASIRWVEERNKEIVDEIDRVQFFIWAEDDRILHDLEKRILADREFADPVRKADVLRDALEWSRRTVESLTASLALSSEQVDVVSECFDSCAIGEAHSWIDITGTNRGERLNAAAKSLRKNRNSSIRTVLRADQWDKFEDWLANEPLPSE